MAATGRNVLCLEAGGLALGPLTRLALGLAVALIIGGGGAWWLDALIASAMSDGATGHRCDRVTSHPARVKRVVPVLLDLTAMTGRAPA